MSFSINKNQKERPSLDFTEYQHSQAEIKILNFSDESFLDRYKVFIVTLMEDLKPVVAAGVDILKLEKKQTCLYFLNFSIYPDFVTSTNLKNLIFEPSAASP